MKAAVITFPGSNRDRDLLAALHHAGADAVAVWHKDADLPAGTDLVAMPGGYSYGDYLRPGAIAAHSPIAAAIRRHAERGGYVLGICNGFQVLTELQLLPGALMRNANLRFVCRNVALRVATADSAFTGHYQQGQQIRLPVAHADGNYQIDPEGLARLRMEDRIALTYCDPLNGAVDDIAAVLSANRRVLGMMPHPESAMDPAVGGTDGARIFASLVAAVVAA